MSDPRDGCRLCHESTSGFCDKHAALYRGVVAKTMTETLAERIRELVPEGASEDWVLVCGYDFEYEDDSIWGKFWNRGKLALRHERGQTYKSTDPHRTKPGGPLIRALADEVEALAKANALAVKALTEIAAKSPDWHPIGKIAVAALKELMDHD